MARDTPFKRRQVETMETEDERRMNMDRQKPFLSRTRLIMILLLAIAIPIFISLANKAVNENSDAIRQILGR